MAICSFDLDGTLMRDPTTIIPFATLLQKSGNKVGILTGRTTADLKIILPLIHERGFYPDFVIGSDTTKDIVNERNREEVNGVWKPKMIEKHGINVAFDNEGTEIHPKRGIVIVLL